MNCILCSQWIEEWYAVYCPYCSVIFDENDIEEMHENFSEWYNDRSGE